MFFFFFNDTATTEIYTLSLHDALPISGVQDRGHEARGHAQAAGRGARRAAAARRRAPPARPGLLGDRRAGRPLEDRKSTRLNSSHANISYAVFCLKKKKQPLVIYAIPL